MLVTFIAAIAACPAVARVTDFTVHPRSITLRLYGFFAMTMFAAIYHILPHVSDVAICPRRIKAHFWFAMPGRCCCPCRCFSREIKQGLKLVDVSVLF